MRDGASFEAVCWFIAGFVCNDLAKGLYEICAPVGPVLMLYGDHLKQACMKEFESHNFRDPSPSQERVSLQDVHKILNGSLLFYNVCL